MQQKHDDEEEETGNETAAACAGCVFRTASVRLVIYAVAMVIAVIATAAVFMLNRGIYFTSFATPIVNSDIWDMELKWLSGVRA